MNNECKLTRRNTMQCQATEAAKMRDTRGRGQLQPCCQENMQRRGNHGNAHCISKLSTSQLSQTLQWESSHPQAASRLFKELVEALRANRSMALSNGIKKSAAL